MVVRAGRAFILISLEAGYSGKVRSCFYSGQETSR
jgi:hypothetical protein